MSRYVKWAQKEHPESKRIAATFLAGFVIVILIRTRSSSLGQRWSAAGLAILVGRNGKLPPRRGIVDYGTFPRRLVRLCPADPRPGHAAAHAAYPGAADHRSFSYCRNPMSLGAILAYLGFGIIAGSVMGLVLVFGCVALLVIYLKRMEEGELAERLAKPTAV